jgi:hypothetical protein
MPGKPKPAAKPAPATNAGPAGTTQADATPAPPAEEEDFAATLARATGTRHVPFSTTLLNDVVASLGVPPDHPRREQRSAAAFGAMQGIGPRDEIEGLMAAHIATLSNTALFCLRVAANAGAAEQGSRLRRDAFAAIRTLNETVAALNTKRNGGAALAIGAAVDAKPRG